MKKCLSDDQFNSSPLTPNIFPICSKWGLLWQLVLISPSAASLKTTHLFCSGINMRFKMYDNFSNFYRLMLACENVQLFKLNKTIMLSVKESKASLSSFKCVLPNSCVSLAQSRHHLYCYLNLCRLIWARDEWTNAHVGMPLIGAYILRTQFSIRHGNVTVICIYPSLSMCLLYWGNPAVAECFFDQTLLTPSVDNLGNSSSSLQLEPYIAMERGGGVRSFE